MTRLTSTIHWDIRLQIRNGFYYAALFVAIVMTLILAQLARPTLTLLFPILILSNVLINTFYFIAGLVLLEKGEGTLEGLIVTPLRTWEYLASKLATLIFLSLLENMAIVLIVYRSGFNLFLLLVGITLLGAFNALCGFMMVIRYDSINSFLFPSIFITTILGLPVLDYFGLWSSWLLYLHPIQAPLLLLKAAFQPVESWQIIYSLLYLTLWIGLVYAWSIRAFYRFVIVKEGVVMGKAHVGIGGRGPGIG